MSIKFKIVKRILNNSIFDENVIYIILHHYWTILPKRKLLLPWIDIKDLDWNELSKNKNAISLLRDNLDKANWTYLSKNKNAIVLLKKHKHFIDWNTLSDNVNAISLLKDNVDKINWMWLSRNKMAIDLLTQNREKINWKYFSENPSIFTDECMPEML